MKISNASTIEALIALFFIIFASDLWLKGIGVVILIHCIYSWSKLKNNKK